MEKWNNKIFENLDKYYIENYEYQYPQILIDKQCFRKGATEEDIIELEKKLQTKLPLSYRNFLLSSNGFVILDEYCELFGIAQINWFIVQNRDWAESWDDNDDVSDEKYFQYGEHQDCIWIRGKYMKTALQISSSEDGYVYLLNPLIIDDRKEWEAWDFGNKLPGAYRYRSFWDMMQKIYQRNFGGQTT
ncbi:SMI1/KNR4 family protein [Nostoc sp.]